MRSQSLLRESTSGPLWQWKNILNIFVCLLFTVLSLLYIPVHFWLSFCVILSPVKIWKFVVTNGRWLEVTPAVSNIGPLVSTNHSLFSGPTGGAWGWHVFWRRWDIWRRTWGMAMPGVVVRWLLSYKKCIKVLGTWPANDLYYLLAE